MTDEDFELLMKAAIAADLPITKDKLKREFPLWEWENRYGNFWIVDGQLAFYRIWYSWEGVPGGTDIKYWNPLNNNAEAFELAIKLMLSIHLDGMQIGYRIGNIFYTKNIELINGDVEASVRRAIVEASAEIGEYLS